jgi:hypothetical protein
MTNITANISPAQIHILPPNGEQGSLLSIHKDGRVTFGPDFTTIDEASLEFWRRLAVAFPVIQETLTRS